MCAKSAVKSIPIIESILSNPKNKDIILELQFNKNRRYVAFILSRMFEDCGASIGLNESRFYKALINSLYLLDTTYPFYERDLEDYLRSVYCNCEMPDSYNLYAEFVESEFDSSPDKSAKISCGCSTEVMDASTRNSDTLTFGTVKANEESILTQSENIDDILEGWK
jgi:hypothetical protein